MIPNKNHQNLSALDVQLQNMAIVNWEGFVNLIGEKAVKKAKICLLRKKGQSLGQIATKLHITKRQADYNCNNCGNELGDGNT